MNSTNLVFVFSSGCLSTCRVPDGGTWGHSPKREAVSVTSQKAGAMGTPGRGAASPSMAFTRPPPLGRPRCAAQAGPGTRTTQALPRGLQPCRGTGNKWTHTHCELSAPAGAARGPSDPVGAPRPASGSQTRLLRGGCVGGFKFRGSGEKGRQCDLCLLLDRGASGPELGWDAGFGLPAGGGKGAPQVWGEERG